MIISAPELLAIAQRAAGLRGTAEGDNLARLFRELFIVSENYNYDFRTNGELTLLNKLRRHDIRTIFDIGANFGEWAKLALETFPDADVFCCEAIPETFAKLSTSLAEESRAKLFNLAVSDKSGELIFNYYQDNPGQTSIFEFPSPYKQQSVSCKAAKLDDIAAEQGVSSIDLLKIDVEGAEHLVLAGAEQLFSKGAIRVVQFEYGMININTKYLLRDFYEFFGKLGFRVGKIYPNTVDFSEYSPPMENFVGPNFVAVTGTESELIENLKYKTMI